ncbi:MAG: hypothetical protein ACR2QJ_01825, partial [Geminicoccaceae bacterium]
MTASALSPAQAISASELNAFNKQVASAYAPYRSAMFYLRTGNPDVAYLDLDTASAAWQSLLDQYRDTPPDVFADDPGYGDALI